jgi:hypothetical protein
VALMFNAFTVIIAVIAILMTIPKQTQRVE